MKRCLQVKKPVSCVDFFGGGRWVVGFTSWILGADYLLLVEVFVVGFHDVGYVFWLRRRNMLIVVFIQPRAPVLLAHFHPAPTTRGTPQRHPHCSALLEEPRVSWRGQNARMLGLTCGH